MPKKQREGAVEGVPVGNQVFFYNYNILFNISQERSAPATYGKPRGACRGALFEKKIAICGSDRSKGRWRHFRAYAGRYEGR